MAQPNISRRSFLAAGLGLVGAQLLAGTACSSDAATSNSASKELIEREIPGKSVIWQAHAAAMEDAKKNGADAVMDFTAGNPSNPTPDELKQAVIDLLNETPPQKLHAYSTPFGITEVREDIAAYLTKKHGTQISADNLIITAGASQAISTAVSICCPINAEVITIAPYYTDYKNLVETQRCTLVPVSAHQPDFQMDIDALEKAINKNTYAVLINTPNNPTGAIYTREKLEDLANLLRKKAKQFGHPIYLFSDEPYRELLFIEEKLPYIPDIYEDTLICYSWSKSLALPGERVGYLYVNEKCSNLKDLLSKVEGTGYGMAHMCTNVTYSRAVAKCMGIPVDMTEYKTNREIVMKIMDDCGFEYIRPDGAFYLWVKSPVEDETVFCEAAQKHHLYLAPGSGFGEPGFFRITLCMDTAKYEQSRAAFEALAKEFIGK